MPRKSTRRQRKGGNGWFSGLTGMLTGSTAPVSSSGAPACMNGSTQLTDAQGNLLFGYPDTQAMGATNQGQMDMMGPPMGGYRRSRRRSRRSRRSRR